MSLDNYIIAGDSLDRGELMSIALYKHLNADYLLIDEKAGRKVAKLNHVKIIGSLGVLIEAKRQGIIPLLKPHIDVLRLSNIHFSNELLDYALSGNTGISLIIASDSSFYLRSPNFFNVF